MRERTGTLPEVAGVIQLVECQLPKRRDSLNSVAKCRKNGHFDDEHTHLRTNSVQQFLSKSVQIGPDREGREK
jgi:hypothetical protein